MTTIINKFKQLWKGIYPPEEERAIFRLIMEKVCHLQPYQFLSGIEEGQLSDSIQQQLLEIGDRLSRKEPIQYILGEADFYGMAFHVAPGVLIPRPETGELVDLIIKENRQSSGMMIDIGTGSGCIAIACAKQLKDWTIYAADISAEALNIAKNNDRLHGSKVHFLQLDVLNTEEVKLLLPSSLDIIVSNPPYIMEKERKDMAANVLDYEPDTALFVPDDDPLLFYRNIARTGMQYLNNNGKLYFEINALCGDITSQLLKEEGYRDIHIIKDLSGKDRIVKAIK